jgi:F420-non-reducing hydrogenase iron-sulfur subunit
MSTGARRPSITVLSCRWCGGVPAEIAGARRIPYPATVTVVGVPCTGTLSPVTLLRALEQGADGVLVMACPSGSCHHLDGNARAAKRVSASRAALVEAGLPADRIRIVELGIGAGQAFADAVRGMSESVAALGPPDRRAAGPAAGGES